MLLVKNLALVNGKKVNLEIKPGTGYVLQGPNGSGKSVLLKTLAGLYSSTWTEFLFQGKEVEEFRPEEFRGNIYYSGSTTHLSGDLTAEEFLKLPFRLKFYEGKSPSIETSVYLKSWGIEGKKLAHLSNGQKQLLCLLRALSLHAKILLLDEPTSHMDREKTAEAEAMIQSWLLKSTEHSYLLVSHSEEQARRLGQKWEFKELIT